MELGQRGRKRRLELEDEYWRLILAGVGTVDACRQVGIGRKTGYRWRAERGGIPPARVAEDSRSSRYLSLLERQRIATLHMRGRGVREIARRLGRSPSTSVLDAWMERRLRDLPVLQASGRPRTAAYVPAGTTDIEPAQQPTWDGIATPQAQLVSVLGPGRNQHRFDLAETEQTLGLTLPSDYKQILHSYGADPHNGINIHAPGARLDLIAFQKAEAKY
jgi:hypothetical protein